MGLVHRHVNLLVAFMELMIDVSVETALAVAKPLLTAILEAYESPLGFTMETMRVAFNEDTGKWTSVSTRMSPTHLHLTHHQPLLDPLLDMCPFGFIYSFKMIVKHCTSTTMNAFQTATITVQVNLAIEHVTYTRTQSPTHIPTHVHTSIQAMNGLKQAIQANTWAALERAIKNAENVAGFNPPELRTARDMLKPLVGSGQSWGRTRVKGLGSGSG